LGELGQGASFPSLTPKLSGRVPAKGVGKSGKASLIPIQRAISTTREIIRRKIGLIPLDFSSAVAMNSSLHNQDKVFFKIT
jgi:hypothetical protein